mmetsp:Transcript_4228/g.26888  ORF Transcript_4228/g.26888 Transcript_4228/m.26888 type:complete len:208 (-) Transcript_4228:178-801(-)
MNSSFMSFMCGSRSNSGWKLSTGLDPFRWFPVSFSSSMVYTLDTWNLTLGPAGVFAIHRYRSLNFLHSKNMQLVHPFISATSLSTCLSSLVSSLTSFLACGSKLSTSVMRCLYLRCFADVVSTFRSRLPRLFPSDRFPSASARRFVVITALGRVGIVGALSCIRPRSRRRGTRMTRMNSRVAFILGPSRAVVVDVSLLDHLAARTDG